MDYLYAGKAAIFPIAVLIGEPSLGKAAIAASAAEIRVKCPDTMAMSLNR